MTPGYESISVLRLTRTLQQLQDPRENTPANELFFNQRTPDVPAAEGEIMGRFIGRAIIADLLPDDAVAGVYSSGKISFETTEVPNLKQGRNLTQSQINQLRQIQGSGGAEPMLDFLTNMMGNIYLGIQWRKEMLQVAMRLDSLNYDRLGMKATGITWGMPSDLKVVTTYPWTDTTNGDPIGDIQTIQLRARIRYGQNFSRVILSTQAFRYAIACTKFQNLAKLLIPPQLTFSNLSTLNLQQQQALFEGVSGVKLEFYDQRFWAQDTAGNLTSAAFLPVDEIILDTPQNDNNANAMDFANGVVTESLVADMAPSNSLGVVGSFGGGLRGPVGYATVTPGLNPPNMTFWGVARGFPRKWDLKANATLKVGAFGDSISVGEPF